MDSTQELTRALSAQGQNIVASFLLLSEGDNARQRKAYRILVLEPTEATPTPSRTTLNNEWKEWLSGPVANAIEEL